MKEYSEAAVEVLDILDNTDRQAVNKIPKDFIKFLIDIASYDYVVNFDHSKPINELNLKERTKELLGVIYINWWCDESQRGQYKKEIEEKEKREQEKLREKYNPDNIFKNKKSVQISNEMQEEINSKNETLAIVNNKENIFKRIINKVISFFK